jgi:hypothetical protein
MAAILRAEKASLHHGMGMFPLLQSGENVGEMQRILRWPGEHDIGKRQDDMMFAVATADRRARAIMGAELPDEVFLFLDNVQLAYIQRISDDSLSNQGRLGSEVQAQAFDLVCGLMIFQKR